MLIDSSPAQQHILFCAVKKLLTCKPQIAASLERLSIFTLRDLLFYRPSSYRVKTIQPNLTELYCNQLIQTTVTITGIYLSKNHRLPTKIMARNHTGTILLVFFNKISPFILSKLQIGSQPTITGVAEFFDDTWQIRHPELNLRPESLLPIEPVYSLTFGMVNQQLYALILNGLKLVAGWLQCAPVDQYHNYLSALLVDLKILHLCAGSILPEQVSAAWGQAIKNLAQKELLANQALLMQARRYKYQRAGRSFSAGAAAQQQILTNLNFQLTDGQKKVIAEIECDQQSPRQMMRLLQGDVGSGKTLVALLTMISVALNNTQSTLMVPTDLLANQHYQFFVRALAGSQIKLALLTGKTPARHRKMINAALENGDIQLLIGTHALFQQQVNFKDLGYIVIDEQHKFGVQQRLSLINKASRPDVLVMTATPIPRSLTLAMFGDMAASQLTGKPKDRQSIITTAISLDKIATVIAALNKKIQALEKIYWVCPLIDQNQLPAAALDPAVTLADVQARYNCLAQIYPGKVGMIHGKMLVSQKDQQMQKFKLGQIQILVATTVIEVGIDVPDATLIVIENIEQFGLAQAHQLRGRVGRSSLLSHCIMLYNFRRLSPAAKQRLAIMKATNDGFYIAEQDLLLRGGGEIVGTKQSGEPEFFFANLAEDLALLIKARELAESCSDSKFIDFQIRLFAQNSAETIKSG